MKKYVIVVAGGMGTRMGAKIPKQFLELDHKAILLHTLENIKQALPQAELVLVLAKSEHSRWRELAKHSGFEDIKLAKGGVRRFDSVKSGLNLIDFNQESLIAIHDAVRPFASTETINEVFNAAEKFGAAIPVIELKDSLREVEEQDSTAVKRSQYRAVQTPQCFQSKILSKAYEQDYKDAFTDDATVVEALGINIQLVEGNAENIKITSPVDLKLASILLKDNL